MRIRAAVLAVGSTGLLLASARAEPTPDPSSIWTIQDENASLSTAQLTDRYYVNGLRIGWTSPTGYMPPALEDFGNAIWGDGLQRISLNVVQQIFTPANTQAKPPVPYDEPYAGYLTATAGLLHDGDNARSLLAVSLGLIGPGAGGEEVQNGFHGIIGQGTNKGWNYQLHNEPALQFLADRVWRLPLATLPVLGGLETDALPELQGQVGTVEDYVLAGINFRIGQGLNADYGVARLTPGTGGSDAFQPVRRFGWYVFAGVDGQFKAHDELLQGNDFADSLHVTMNPLVGEAQVGAAIIFAGFRLTYTQVIQTQTFHDQHGGPHQFGSLALSARF